MKTTSILVYHDPIEATTPDAPEEGSLAWAAEQWMLSQELTVPSESKHPHLYQGMLDEFLESEAGKEFI
jgi:hypothetical protein